MTLYEFQESGGQVTVAQLPRKDGEPSRVVIVLDDVALVDGNFVAAW